MLHSILVELKKTPKLTLSLSVVGMHKGEV